jgi:hypothetical protein
VSSFIAGRIIPVWAPFLRLEFWVHEVCCVEVGAECVRGVFVVCINWNLLAKDGRLEGLGLIREAKAGLELIHRRSERPTSFDGE